MRLSNQRRYGILMITLEQLAGTMLGSEAEIWGHTVRDCMPQLKVMAVAGAKDHFTQQRGPDGKPWAPLSHPRPNGGDKVLRDRGLMMASISASVTEVGLKLSASSPGANLMNFGGTVKPKKGKFLSIPLTKDAKRAGGARNFPRPLFAVGVVSGNVFLGESKGKGKRQTVVYHYVLVKSVTVPARLFIGFSQETLNKMTRLLLDKHTSNVAAAIEGKQKQAANDALRF